MFPDEVVAFDRESLLAAMNWLLTLPLIIPLLGACLGLAALNSPRHQRRVGLVASTLLLIIGVALVWVASRGEIHIHTLGSWAPPFGIVLVLDRLSAMLVFLSGLMSLVITLYSGVSMDHRRISFGYYPLVLLLILGVNGAFLTGDLFNLFVWFEVLLISSFVLLILGGEKRQLEGAVKYVTMNLLGSAIFLAALGLLYGLTGTLNMVDIGVRLAEADNPGLVGAVAMLLLVSFGMKAAVFPMFFWLPSSYHTPPIVITALFSGLLTKVGLYSMIRAFTLMFTENTGSYETILIWIAGITMLTGVLGALAQYDVRRLLAFHSISQIGYMVMGLALMSVGGLAATLYFVLHHSAVKSSLFLISGIMERIRGTYDLKQLGGLYHTRPFYAILFFVAAMTLAGIPPTSGFFAKLGLVFAGLEAQQYALVAVALVTSMMTLYSMTKIWAEAFWKAPPDLEQAVYEREDPSVGPLVKWMLPILILVGFTALMGALAQPCLEYATAAAEQAFDRDAYVAAILGDAK